VTFVIIYWLWNKRNIDLLFYMKPDGVQNHLLASKNMHFNNSL